jgi:acetyl-CoA carboxylase beta subunit
MSEKLHYSSESLPTSVEASAETERNLERLREAAKQAEKDPLSTQIESLQQTAETKAISGKEINVADASKENTNQSFGISKDLKADAYKKSLRHIRTSLRRPERAFSRIVHNQTIETISSGAAKTVARPSAFLGGSMGALVGSATLLYMSKQYGFTYNYTVLLVLFTGGFIVGLIVELLVRLLFKRAS